jgi:sugar phosphate isomerase/epimerase
MLPPISFQPITLQKKYNLDDHAELILGNLALLGVDAIEGGPTNPNGYTGLLRRHGLRFSGQHIALSSKPDVKHLIDYAHACGGEDVCNSGVLSWDKPGLPIYTESIKLLNDMGRQLKREGIRFHYHNHAFEFDAIDGSRTGMDVLLDSLDPDAVDFCIDVAWVWRGKRDPAEFLRFLGPRIGYIHLKDTTETEWKELGTGKLNWPSIISAIATLPNVRYAALEQDKVEIEPWKSISMSRMFLAKRFGW